MKLLVLSWLILVLFNVASSLVHGQCRNDQRLLLLRLKSGLEFSSFEFLSFSSTKLVEWNRTDDCCVWNGVECDEEGRVVGLDLSGKMITGGINDSSSLFDLEYLKVLNLSLNIFRGPIPSRIGNLVNLAHLNLSKSGYEGQIPVELSNLTRLVTLDLSSFLLPRETKRLKLDNPNLASLVQNLGKLEELYLDNVNISVKGAEWCEAFPSSLPNLRVLSMSGVYSFSPIHSSLQNLILSYKKFSGGLFKCIGNLQRLSRLYLSACNFTGPIPRSIEKLKLLVEVDLSSNQFNGTLPLFAMAKNLTSINLSHNKLTGGVPTQWESLEKLGSLDISNNMLSGRIPSSLFSHLSLQNIQLSSNNFNGSVDLEWLRKLINLRSLDLSYNNLSIVETGNSSLPQLSTLRLVSCNLETFPNLRNHSKLTLLDLSDNKIKGKVPKWIWNIGNGSFFYLNISHNLLFDFEEDYSNPTTAYVILDLHANMFSGKLPSLPTSASYLDYSSNNFNSSIHVDPVMLSSSFLRYLSLSNNSLTGTIPESVCNAPLQVLDLSNNELSGNVPECLFEMGKHLGVLSLGGNKLNGSLADAFPQNCAIETLDLSGNQIEGKLPRSLANCSNLEVLNIGHNQISDIFPCHLKSISNLRVMVLRSNRFYGSISCEENHNSWPMLQIIDLAINNLTGELDQDSLKTWKAMMSDGNATTDYIYFGFMVSLVVPQYYQDKVTITAKGLELQFSKILTINTGVDLSRNKFKGLIPDIMGEFSGLRLLNLSHNALEGPIPSGLGNLHQLESLDLSSNQLAGEIPKELTQLNFLSFLNLSYNELVGEIPTEGQLQTFTVKSFEGNKALCGGPLRNCHANIEPPPTQYAHPVSEDDDIDTQWILIMSAGIGFVFGFWIFIGPLIVCKRWITWYSIHVDELLSCLFPRLYGRTR